LGIDFKLLALGARKYGVVVISFKVSAQESKPVKSQTTVLASNFQRPAGALGKVETWHTAVALFSPGRGGHEM
jgi:hypothetical protein